MKSDIQGQIKAKIETFAGELEALVRQAAVDAVSEILGHGGAKVSVTRLYGSRGPRALRTIAAAHVVKGRRGRRPSPASSAVAERIVAHFRSHPGQRAEEARAALRVEKSIWNPAIRRLIDMKKLSKRGEKRATTYTAA
jgi:hypothetical protein